MSQRPASAAPRRSRRIAIVTHEYFPVLCGGTTMAHNLAVELATLGHTTEIWTCQIGWGLPNVERRDGFTVRRFFTGRLSNRDSRLWEHISFVALGLPQMIYALWRHPADTLLSIFIVPSGLVGLALSCIFRARTFVHVDAADIPGIDSAMKRWTRYLGLIVRIVSRHSTGMIITAGLEDLAAPYMATPRTTVVPSGLQLPAEQARPGNHVDPVRFLSIGRLVLRKGFLDLVRAFSLVRARREDFLLTIVGHGPLEDKIHAAIGSYGLDGHIRMAGRVEYERLKEHYLATDCYIFYGSREGSSLALIEALGYGLPIIASDDPGDRLYVQEGRNGLLAEQGRPDRLAEVILHLLENRGRIASWGQQSRIIALKYTWHSVAERYLAFFDQMDSTKV